MTEQLRIQVPSPTPLERAMVALKRAKAQLEANERQRTEPIAVVGLACRFPGGANDLDRYWQLLDREVDAVRPIPRGRVPADPAFPDTVSAAGLIDDVDRFDAEFFGISAREAERLDPQQRLLLEVTWEALEIAGHAPNGLSGTRTGVYVGIGSPDYLRRILRCNPGDVDGQVFTGSLASVAAGRIAYLLGLQGPCMAIDTACSSSLVAVHQACQSLRTGESDLALAGGVNLILSPESSYVLRQLQALSPDGRCKTFDARANGYVRGEGCGVVVLKRLSDAQRDGDRIWALVRGSAVNQDGRSAGLTAPNMLAQQALLRQALHSARVEPEQIGYVETHGTGTPLGDPIEIEALIAVLGRPRGDGSSCVLGAVKTNIGHLEAAAGVAGLIKAILAFDHEAIPANLHFRTLNPRISLAGTPLVIADAARPWRPNGKPRFAGISSFGISGTNAAVILEEPPRDAATDRAPPPQAPNGGPANGSHPPPLATAAAPADRDHHVLTLSARSPAALGRVIANAARHLDAADPRSLGDLCFTSRVGRAHFAYRAAFVAASTTELRDQLAAARDVGAGEAGSRPPRIGFVFTGQGSQYAGMGHGLYRHEPVFRAALDRCAGLFAGELPRALLDVMWQPDPGELDQTLYSQPALFALALALVELWRSWGVAPDVVLGHSLGEYAAAVTAGVMSLDDACRLVALRARACQALGPGGAMAAVEADPAVVEAVVAELGGDLAIAAYNAPTHLSVSGPIAQVDAAGERLRARGAKVRPIQTSCAFHSPLMAPMVAGFARFARQVRFSAPRIPWITNVTGDRAGDEQGVAAYWEQQLCAPVRFTACVAQARALGCELWVEIGPNPVLLGAVSRSVEAAVVAPSLHHGRPDDAVIARAVATLYEHGAKLDFRAFDLPFARRRVALPTYPFEHERHWFPLASPVAVPGGPAHPLLGRRVNLPGSEIQFAGALAGGHAELTEHRLHGRVVVPAAHYVAAFLAAIDEVGGGRAIADVAFPRALMLADEAETPVAVVVGRSGAGARLAFFAAEGARPETTDWTLHASATQGAPRAEGSARTTAPVSDPTGDSAAAQPDDLASLRARCARSVDPAQALASVWTEVADVADRAGPRPAMYLGPRFRRIAELWLGASEALARLALPEGPAAGVTGVPVTVLDSCFQLLGLATGPGALDAVTGTTGTGDAWMPIGIDHVEVYGPAARAAVWAHASASALAGGQLVRGDVVLLDRAGAPVARLTGVSLQRVAQEALKPPAAWRSWLYELVWQRVEATPGDRIGPALVAGAAFVVVLDQRGYGERFAREVEARGGAVVRVARAADLACDPPLDAGHVIAFSALDPGEPAEVAARALGLLQTMSRVAWRRAPRIWWVTEGAQVVMGDSPSSSITRGAPGYPQSSSIAQAGVWGLARCAALELPELWGGIVDLDPRDGAAGVDRLFDVLASANLQVAVRSGAVFAARLERVRRRAPAPLRLFGDATYVISGGLGGIGWPLVNAWIERGARHVVVLGRSAPSQAQQRRIDELAQRGARVRVVCADVSDADAVTAAWDAVRAELPPVHGVVHAAGVLDDAALVRLDAQRLAAVLAPKLAGAEHLRRITGGAALDFFAMFSSLAGVLGSPGQASYAAANAGLDALAAELRAHGVPATSIAWGPWQVGFAAAHQDALAARGIAAMPIEPALEALAECLAQGVAHIVVTAADLPSVAARLPERSRAILGSWLSAAPRAADLAAGAAGASPSPAQATAPSTPSGFLADVLAAAPPRRRALVLDRATGEIRRLLGRAPQVRIDPTQSLFELGLDSLTAVQFRAVLQRTFGCSLPASLAFEHPTLDALADALVALVEADHRDARADGAAGAAPEAEIGAEIGAEITAAPGTVVASAAAPIDGLLGELRSGRLALSSLPAASLAALADAVRARGVELPVLAAAPIAIIGMGCRYPGGVTSPDELWDLLRRGGDAITEIPPERWNHPAWYDPSPGVPDKTPIRHGGFLDDVAGFDAGLFRISPREARCMDPQHRLLLEVAWQALEDAGQDPQQLAGTSTGVFVGFMNNDYASLAELAELEGHLATGNGISNAVGRLSFVLGVHGPCVALDTACSSSLVAIHGAVDSLRKRESDLALAGGVSLILSPGLTVLMSQLGALARDGHCKTFDAAADGYVRSEGCGLVVLKRLTDAVRDRDRVVAVIRGSAVNHGGRSGGFSQPNARAQQELLRRALAVSQTLPHQVSYLEAHGTGTPLGDPIEYRAAAAVYSAGRGAGDPLHIGSIKTNLGHTEAAAGVAGVLKVALALQARQIPPHRNLTTLSPEIDLTRIPAKLPTALTAWPAIEGRRIAGVSSFGMSGINAHVVLEEAGPRSAPPDAPLPAPGPAMIAAPGPAPAAGESVEQPAELVALSAQSDAALRALVARYQRALGDGAAASDHPLRDIAGTTCARRAHHEVRLALIAKDLGELRGGLAGFAAGQIAGSVVAGASEAGRRPRVVFVCPGQGSQWLGMGRALYATEPAFSGAIDRCDQAMQRHVRWRLVERLHATEPPAGIDVIQPMLFAMSVALGALWRAWGVEPDAVVGHSMGEVAAAHLAGALSLEDAARIICERSRLMLDVAGRGAMAMVELGARALEPRLVRYAGALGVAASNSTRSSVVTGEPAAVELLLGELAGDRVFARPIKVDVASHGPQVDPIAQPLLACLEGIRPAAAAIPLWSSVTASLADGATLGPAYWMKNLREPVRFAETIAGLLAAGHALFLELSPHPILTTAIEHTALDGGHPAWTIGSLGRGKPERAAMLQALAELYVRGYPVDFRRLYPAAAAVALPTYPFQHQRYWLEPVKTTPLLLRHRADLAAAPAVSPVAATPGDSPATTPAITPSWARDAAAPTMWTESLAHASPQVARALLRELVAREVRSALGLAQDLPLSGRATFTELGMDSVMALRLVTRLGHELGVRLSAVVVYEHPTPAGLTEHLAGDVLALSRAVAPSPAAPDDPDDDDGGSGDDDDLSEDDLAALLREKLDAHADPG